MRMNLLIGMVTVGLSGALAGCSAVPTKVTGGGWMPGAEGGRANIGFNADSCSGNVVGRFNYRDPSYTDVERGGVGMNGDVVEAVQCVPEDGNDEYPDICIVCADALDLPVHAALLNYRSTNPWARGAGQAVACMIDNGQGANATGADLAVVRVLNGPFEGYFNSGPVQGNIKEHEC